MLPQTVRTPDATFTLTTSTDGQYHLPGFWTTEHANTRSKYYNGLLKSLYAAHMTHSRQSGSTPPSMLRGLQPSVRWYGYQDNHHPQPTSATTTHSPGGRAPGGGGPRNPPGRGHPKLPHPWGPASSSSTADTHTTVDLPSDTRQILAQLVDMGRATMVTTQTIQGQINAQARINNDVQLSIDRINATLAALSNSSHQ